MKLRYATFEDTDQFNGFQEKKKAKGVKVKVIAILPFKQGEVVTNLTIFYQLKKKL